MNDEKVKDCWFRVPHSSFKVQPFARLRARLPAVAPVRFIVAGAEDVGSVIVGLSVDPRAPQIEAESYRRIHVERRGYLHDSWWLGQLLLDCCASGLMIFLGFQLIDGVLLGLHACLECCDLVALRLDEGR